MLTYNRIMQLVWLLATIFIFVFISYMSYTDGIKKWGFYYIFACWTLIMFFIRRWMMKRMKRHIEFMANKDDK